MSCSFTREKVLKGLIQLSSHPSKLQLAELLTKALPSHQLQPLLSKLGMITLAPSLQGDIESPSTKNIQDIGVQ